MAAEEDARRLSLDARRLARLGFAPDPATGAVRIGLPSRANIAADTVGRHAAGERRQATALVYEEADGAVKRWTFAELDSQAAALAAWLANRGVRRGDPVGVHTGQRPETAIAHLAIHRLGAIVVTLSQLYGPDTVRHVLADSGLRVVFTETDAWARLGDVAAGAGQRVEPVFVGGRCGDASPFAEALASMRGAPVEPVATGADEPALLMYTSGSTGLPKGLLHAHRILHAYMPTVRMFYDADMATPGQVYWTPADWAWVGGLLDLVLPAWHEGHAVVASQHRFEPEWAFDFMARHGVTHTFMTPTALKRLAEIDDPRSRRDVKLRVVCTGGESLPSEIVRWCERALGATCNEFYGLTEFNHLVGNCRALYPVRPGSMGRAYPGHGTTIVDEAGNELPDGEVGEIVAPADDPTLFLGYWGELGVPQRLRLGRWIRTNDLARRDADGYFWYQGRNDDLIKSAGYRIGPAEVEDALVRHPAVAEAAVVASPDPARGSVVKAFVRLAPGGAASDALAEELKQFVRTNLAAYKYPREIEFVESFPLTSSGKIRRAELRQREIARKRGSAPR